MLKDKIIVVTGGAGLLGRAFCKEIANARGFVVVADSNLDAAKTVAQDLAESGLRAEAAYLDITNKSTIEELISNVNDAYGTIDCVVNNAYPRNKNYGKILEDVEYVDFCENVSTHIGGYFLVAQRFALYFSNNGGGNIVNMASIYGSMPPVFEMYLQTEMTMPVEYAAIKSAIIHLTKYFAQYYKKNGIRVNSLSPGGVFDNQNESFVNKYEARCGKVGMLMPTDVSRFLIFLLSDASLNMTGQNLIVDDGFSL